MLHMSNVKQVVQINFLVPGFSLHLCFLCLAETDQPADLSLSTADLSSCL